MTSKGDIDSRISGFYKLPLLQRRVELRRRVGLTAQASDPVMEQGGLDVATADRMVENAVGLYSLPLGLGLNFRVNSQDYVVPMAVEEPSVIAAASNAARIVRAAGGFVAEADEPLMTGQIELLDVADPEAAIQTIDNARVDLLARANNMIPRMVARGGGARSLSVRRLQAHPDTAEGYRLVVHITIDCRDAMGANLVNTVAEGLASRLAELAKGRSGLRILTNLNDERCVRLHARAPFEKLATRSVPGAVVAEQIESASRFAELDPYRAATHNKGVMNGVDAVVIATGNDWRGVEAGAHAFAARTGHYSPLCTWRVIDEALVGRLEMPLAVGTVGGTLGVHAGARLAQETLHVGSATELAGVIGAVGMASNLAALRALATDGIQLGHMACHRRATATPEAPNTAARPEV